MIGDTELVSIVAVAENGVIGTDHDGLPWDGYEEDKKHFNQTIQGSPLLMGRRTAQRGGEFRKFTDAPHIVLTSNPDRNINIDNIKFVGSVDEAKTSIRQLDSRTVYNIGGGQVYKEFFNCTDRLIVSHLHNQYDGTVYFPEIDENTWKITSTDERDGFTIKHYKQTNQNS